MVILDPADGSSLLADHVNAGLWLPPDGHVEPGEHPDETARRQTREELGVEPMFLEQPPRPCFLTVTRTTGAGHAHFDVRLWFLLVGQRNRPLTIDRAEFAEARWWTPADIATTDPHRFDPHHARFRSKVRRSTIATRRGSRWLLASVRELLFR